MSKPTRKLNVFLCHASQDKPIVRDLYQRLSREGWIDPWLDEEKLLPGHDWDMEIEKAVEAADVVIVCLSKDAVTKEGYIQKEIKKVLDVSDHKPEGTIFIIPLRLDEYEPPRRLSKWQYVDYFPAKQKDLAYKRVLQSLKTRNSNTPLESEQQEMPKKATELRKFVVPTNRYDHHSALLSEQIAQASGGGVKFISARLQWGKDNVGYSLHGEPNSFSTAGMQTTDFLAYLGFKRELCSFVPQRQCYAAWIDSTFELPEFANKFAEAFAFFEKGTRLLESCGHFLDRPEGLGYFMGKDSSRKNYKSKLGFSADGHTAAKSQKLKHYEDDKFYYEMSWIESNREAGWVFHYKPKNGENQQLESVIRFLGLSQFKECPYFKFEKCYWLYIQYENRGDSSFDGNTDFAHKCFDSHEENFSSALQMLIQANDLLFSFGFHFLNP